METNNNENLIHFMLLGDTCVGKTCLIQNFVKEKFDINSISTIGHDFKTKNIEINKNGEKKSFKLKIWDTAGQERFRSIQKHYYNKVDGILFIYDITNKTSFDIIEQWYNEVKNYNDNIIGVLIGNKTDLEDNKTVTTEQGKELAKKLNFPFYECNSVDGENVHEAFESLVKMILEEKNKNKNKETDTALKIEDKRSSEQRQNESSRDRKEGCVC